MVDDRDLDAVQVVHVLIRPAPADDDIVPKPGPAAARACHARQYLDHPADVEVATRIAAYLLGRKALYGKRRYQGSHIGGSALLARHLHLAQLFRILLQFKVDCQVVAARQAHVEAVGCPVPYVAGPQVVAAHWQAQAVAALLIGGGACLGLLHIHRHANQRLLGAFIADIALDQARRLRKRGQGLEDEKE